MMEVNGEGRRKQAGWLDVGKGADWGWRGALMGLTRKIPG